MLDRLSVRAYRKGCAWVSTNSMSSDWRMTRVPWLTIIESRWNEWVNATGDQATIPGIWDISLKTRILLSRPLLSVAEFALTCGKTDAPR